MFGSIVPPGTIVRTKVALGGAAHGASAILLFTDGSCCRILIDGGVAHVARHEVSVPRVPLPGFIPMRLRLPYGRWVEPDGTEVLFSRDYCPLWKVLPSRDVQPDDPWRWVHFEKQEWFWKDGNPPWRSRDTERAMVALLKRFKVHNVAPRLADALKPLLFGQTERIREAVKILSQRAVAPAMH